MKHQVIRLADVFVVGPLMIYGGLHGESLHQAARIGLFAFGIGTIIFNGMNWIKIEKRKNANSNISYHYSIKNKPNRTRH